MRPIDFLLLGAVIFGWSTSWLPLKWQAVEGVAPEVSVMWRFVLAGGIMMLFALVSGQWRLSLRGHLLAAAIGTCLFSMNFTLFYYGAYGVTSGLLAVVFATASLINLFYARVVFGSPIGILALFGSILGFGGVVALYWPELRAGGAGFISLGLCITGTFLFCSGNMLSSWAQRQGQKIVPTSAWGMLYGATLLAVIALVRGKDFTVAPTATYLGGLVWLAIFSSVLAFAAYLTLIGRAGPARAGYATVLFPPFALAISTLVEGYRIEPVGYLGMAMITVGLILVQRRSAN